MSKQLSPAKILTEFEAGYVVALHSSVVEHVQGMVASGDYQ